MAEVAARVWILGFRSNLGDVEAAKWLQLQESLARQKMSPNRDRVWWKFDSKGNYTVRYLYRFMVDPGCRDLRVLDIWNTKLPLKIQIFKWMLYHDRPRMAVQLKNRKWDGPREM